MATVNILQSKRLQTRAGLAFILSYCKRESKIRYGDRRLATGVNCVAESVYREMMNTKMQYGKTDGRMYYHFVQSFSPKEKLTPETAHEIALRFAEEQFGGYEVLVATHVDREHIHSHFIVNSVSCEDGRKYHSDRENLQALRQASDALCLQYGLSVVQPKEKSQKVGQMSSREYRSAERGESWKLRLAVTIEDAMKYARSREHFISLMEAEGYAVKWTDERKSITYTTPEGFRCRDNKLHEEKFLKENMEYEFGIRTEILEGIERTGQSADPDGGESEPCITVTEPNWKALIAAQNTQVKMLAEIQDGLTLLATEEKITDDLNGQMVFFPNMGVRFIAINDGVDSLVEGSNDFSPIRNWANELHAKDSSKKVRAVKKLQAERGERLGGRPPYGYKKVDTESKEIIPDEEDAAVYRGSSPCAPPAKRPQSDHPYPS